MELLPSIFHETQWTWKWHDGFVRRMRGSFHLLAALHVEAHKSKV
jgi:hypothetical protein